MIKRDELTHPRSCINKAADDEPFFVLRSSDRYAPVLVDLWATLAQLDGCPLEKVDEARALARGMRSYAQERGGSKSPD